MNALIWLSLILHAGVIFYLYLRHTQQRSGEYEIKEIERLLKMYTEKMAEENRRFLQEFTRIQKVKNEKTTASRKRVDLPVETVENEKKELSESKGGTPFPKKSENHPSRISITAQNMRKEGATIEEIARSLNKGKGEVELLLKLGGNEKN